MKLTPYKIAKIKSILPAGDREKIEKELEDGELSSSTKSLLDHWANKLAPERLSRTKGAFGSKGLNRKQNKVQEKKKILEMIKTQKENDQISED